MRDVEVKAILNKAIRFCINNEQKLTELNLIKALDKQRFLLNPKSEDEMMKTYLINNKPVCPRCGYEKSNIVDKRLSEHSLRRRRVCQDCGQRFKTIEIIYNKPIRNNKK